MRIRSALPCLLLGAQLLGCPQPGPPDADTDVLVDDALDAFDAPVRDVVDAADAQDTADALDAQDAPDAQDAADAADVAPLDADADFVPLCPPAQALVPDNAADGGLEGGAGAGTLVALRYGSTVSSASCQPHTEGSDRVVRFTVPMAEQGVLLHTLRSTADTVLSVWNSCGDIVPGRTPLACNDDWGHGPGSLLRTRLAPGEHQLLVDLAGSGPSEGAAVVGFRTFVPAANVSCDAAQAVSLSESATVLALPAQPLGRGLSGSAPCWRDWTSAQLFYRVQLARSSGSTLTHLRVDATPATPAGWQPVLRALASCAALRCAADSVTANAMGVTSMTVALDASATELFVSVATATEPLAPESTVDLRFSLVP